MNRMSIRVVTTVLAGALAILGLSSCSNDEKPVGPSDQVVSVVPEYGAIAGTAVRNGDTATCDPGLATVPLRQGGTVSHNSTHYTATWDNSAMTIKVTNTDGNPLAAEPLKGIISTLNDGTSRVAVLSAGERKAHTFVVSNDNWGALGDIKICAEGM